MWLRNHKRLYDHNIFRDGELRIEWREEMKFRELTAKFCLFPCMSKTNRSFYAQQ